MGWIYSNIIFSEDNSMYEKSKKEMGIFISYLLYIRNTFDLCHFQYESWPFISSIFERRLLVSELSNDLLDYDLKIHIVTLWFSYRWLNVLKGY